MLPALSPKMKGNDEMKQAENEKSMSDQYIMEEHLAETLLDRVTGGAGRVQDCPECFGHLQQYNSAKMNHDAIERRVDEYVRIGQDQRAYGTKAAADSTYKL